MMTVIQWIRLVLFSRPFLHVLLYINLFGTIYGYIWYMPQLEKTEPLFWLFVPDSPTASLFFTIAILGWILRKPFKLMEALAVVTLFKYGVWAVVMNLLTYWETGYLHWTGWMLVASHGAMAIQALLYARNYSYGIIHIIIAAIWTLHNDVIDYVFGQMPVYYDIMKYSSQVGYFTFWLSIVSIAIAFIIWHKNDEHKTAEKVANSTVTR